MASSVRMLLPPPEVLFARLLATTLATVTWRALVRELGLKCSIAQSFDQEKQAEYVEISCEEGDADLYAAALWRVRGGSMTRAAWDPIKVSYDEGGQKLVFDAGGFPPPQQRPLQDLIFAKPVKYFYGRGFAMEALKLEQVKRGRKGYVPYPVGGFVDFSLKNAIGYVWALERLREGLRTTVAGRVVHVLLADLGDSGLGLAEAVDRLYDPRAPRECVEAARSRGTDAEQCARVSRPEARLGIALPPRELRADLGLWAKYSLYLSLASLVLEGSVELLPRWPTVAVVSYPAGSRPLSDDTRMLDGEFVSPEDVFTAVCGLRSSAEQLGVRTLDLARSLASLLRCAAELGRSRDRVSEASALTSRALPAIDSCLRGAPDRDLVYSVVRMVAGLASGKGAPEPCRWFLRRLGW